MFAVVNECYGTVGLAPAGTSELDPIPRSPTRLFLLRLD